MLIDKKTQTNKKEKDWRGDERMSLISDINSTQEVKLGASTSPSLTFESET